MKRKKHFVMNPVPSSSQLSFDFSSKKYHFIDINLIIERSFCVDKRIGPLIGQFLPRCTQFVSSRLFLSKDKTVAAKTAFIISVIVLTII